MSKISPLKLIRFKFVEISYFYSFWIWFGSHDLSFSGIRIRFLFFCVIYCLGTVNPKFPKIVIRQISCKITSELAFSVFGAKFDEFLRWFENIHMKFNPLRHSGDVILTSFGKELAQKWHWNSKFGHLFNMSSRQNMNMAKQVHESIFFSFVSVLFWLKVDFMTRNMVQILMVFI